MEKWRSFVYKIMNRRVPKIAENVSITEELLAYQEGLCYVEFVN